MLSVLHGRVSDRLTVFLVLLLTESGASFALADDVTPRLYVSGQGSDAIPPDMAVVSLTVTREAKTARAALDANSAAMKKVIEAMKAHGVAERDLQTANFSITPNYPRYRNDRDEPPRISGYTVRNGLTVRVRDLASVGIVLDKAVSLGVNEGGNIQFTNADPEEALTRARVRAVEAARRKAQTLADAAGVTLGEVLEINEQSHGGSPVPMARAEMRLAAADSVPVAGGENTYRVSVNMTFAIAP